MVNETSQLEVGYHVLPAVQGLGYATEAATACRDYAQSLALAPRIVAIIHRENRASQRTAEKIGMSLDPTLHHASPVHDVFAVDI